MSLVGRVNTDPAVEFGFVWALVFHFEYCIIFLSMKVFTTHLNFVSDLIDCFCV